MDNIEPKKRGRKKKDKNYFNEFTEESVRNFLLADNQKEKDRIFREELQKPIEKLAEFIINRYRLYRKGWTFEELHSDAVSHLMTKTYMFKPEKEKKAYSYYGTTLKNYLIAEIRKDKTKERKSSDFESTMFKLEEDESYSYTIEKEQKVLSNKFIDDLKNELQREIDDLKEIEYQGDDKKKFIEDRIKVGIALIDIFSNWDTLQEELSKSKKYNKNLIFLILTDQTHLERKDINEALLYFKSIYKFFKNAYINNIDKIQEEDDY
jgi:hypothetical protein